MNLIKIAAMDNGAHENRNSPGEATVPEGWAVIPAGVAIPDSFPFVDVLVEEKNTIKTVTKLIGKEITVDETEVSKVLEESKQSKIVESKTALSEYLASHPLQWTDGKYYSVTSEKQALLTSNLSLYQLAISNGKTFPLKWNTTGDECTGWKYEDLASLAMAIGTYVQPFVSRQQELELAIKACTTMDELYAIEINYDPVLKQYLETAGRRRSPNEQNRKEV
jgi:hypothetical protein